MDESRLEQSLHTLKERLPVNEELKRRLREELVKRKPASRVHWRKWGSAAAAAAVLLVGICAFLLQGPDGIPHVAAQSLQVQNQVSFVDIGTGSPLDFAEYKDTVYIPIAGKGLFAYDNQGFHQLLNKEVVSVKINPSGTQLAVTSDGSLAVYSLADKQYRELLHSEDVVYYEQPSWKDDHTILYVKKVVQPGEEHGFTVKESGIYELDLNTQHTTKLAEGSAPSYDRQENALVFETRVGDEPQIVRKALKGGQETVIDKGRFPSVSPDGAYIAYVKTEETSRELKPGASVQEQIEQVWIADFNGETKRSVTYNTVMKSMSEEEWLKDLQPGTVPQILVQSGMFSYYNPVWSTNSDSLYALKNRNGEGAGMSVMRIDLTAQTLQSEEVVKAFNQAAIVRDDQFLRSLLTDGQEWISTSNPHQVSFTIFGTGTENGQTYVDVEQNSAYTANPDYSVGYVRYYLVPSDNGYRIQKTEPMPGGEDTLVGEQRDGSIALSRGDGRPEPIFSAASIPEKFRPAGKYRIASLAYLMQQKQVVFTVQAMQDPDAGQRASVKVMMVDSSGKSFKQLADIPTLAGRSNVGVESLIVSPDGRFAALNLYSDEDPKLQSHVVLVDLEKKTSELLESRFQDTAIEGTRTYYWEGDSLHFTITVSGQQLHYVWNALAGRVERP